MNFVGYDYRRERPQELADENGEDDELNGAADEDD